MSWLSNVLRPEIMPFMIPVVAIIVGGLVVIVKVLIHHRERMAMIERGMDPDRPAEPYEGEGGPDANA